MKRAMMGVVLVASLAGCTYAENPNGQPLAGAGYVQQPAYGTGYVQQPAYGAGSVQQPAYGTGYAQQPVYAAPPAPLATSGYRDGSYERERQAYEYGRRDQAAQGWR